MTTPTYQPVTMDFIESQRICLLLEPIAGFRLIHGEEMRSGWFYVVDSKNKSWWVHEASGTVLACASQWETKESDGR